MSLDTLLQKAEENFKTAEWAEKKNYFDAAVSRYYYYVFEKIIYISKKQGFYKKPVKNYNSHTDTIKNFSKSLENKLTEDEIVILSNINKLRIERKKSDYKERKIVDLNEFNLKFKDRFNPIRNVLEKLLEEEKA